VLVYRQNKRGWRVKLLLQAAVTNTLLAVDVSAIDFLTYFEQLLRVQLKWE